jgi:tRNA(adenine34) deaminase
MSRSRSTWSPADPSPAPMALALQEAEAAAAAGEVPVGAVILAADGTLLARDHNRIEERADPTAHAELLVIRAAAASRGSPRLVDCDLYVTLEPCPMCAAAASLARLRRIYYGAEDPKGGGVEHGPRIFASSSCHHRPEVYGGIAASRAGELLRAFFRERR